jgi:hypothetical protein
MQQREKAWFAGEPRDFDLVNELLTGGKEELKPKKKPSDSESLKHLSLATGMMARRQ